MSFTSISLKTDYEKFVHIFTIFYNHEPKWTTVAETDLAFLATVVNSIAKLTDSIKNDLAVSNVLGSVQKDLVLATRFIQVAESNQNITNIIGSLLSNLKGLLTLPAIQSHASIADITPLIEGAIAEVQAILNAIPKTV